MSHERQYRMKDIVPADRLAGLDIAVIGVGAIGRNVALLLAQIGAESLTLIDPDTIEELNCGPQGFWPSEVGCDKVTGVRGTLLAINPDLLHKVHIIKDVYKPGQLSNETVIFACVDSMRARADIFNSELHHLRFFCDGRMAAESCRILTVEPVEKFIDHYRATLHTDDEAIQESCTAKATCYCANIAAGFMVGQFTKWLRGMPLETPELLINILSGEIHAPPLKS